MFWTSGIVGEVASTPLKEIAIPGAVVFFFVNRRNGFTKPSNGSVGVKIDSLASCFMKN